MSATMGHDHASEVWGFAYHMVDKANRNTNKATLRMVARNPELADEVDFDEVKAPF